MTTRLLLALAFLLASLLPLSAAAQPRGTVLAWRWDEGAVRRYRVTQELEQDISGLQEKHVSWTISYLVKQEVRSVAAATGVATVAQTYESGVVAAMERSEAGEERAAYDSSKPDAGDKAKHRLIAPYAAFVGETLVFDVDSEGKVLKLEGAQKILAKVMAGLGESNPMLAPILESYKQTLSDDSMRAELERQLRVVPGRSVRPRDDWKVAATQVMPLVGAVRNETTYTLERLRKDRDATIAEIRAEGTLRQEAAGAAPGGGGGGGGVGGGVNPDPLGAMLDVKIESSAVRGQTRFDAEAGAIAASSYEIETVWKIGIKGGGELEEALRALGGGGAAGMEQRMRQRGGMELVTGR